MDKSQVRSCLSATGSITYDPLTGIIGGGGGGVTPAALTKVDDTNVTLTLGGTPATALLQATSLTLGWSGQLSVARGGTGLSALGTANQLLRVNAGATALEYFTPTYLTGLTVGTTPIASGTVGRVLFEGAGNVLQENAILNLDTTNGLIIGGTTARGTRLTLVNAADTLASKTLVIRNAADSSETFSFTGNGIMNLGVANANSDVITLAGASWFRATSTPATIQFQSVGFGNTITTVQTGSNIFGCSNTFTGAGSAFNHIIGYNNTIRANVAYCNIIGNGVDIQANSTRITVIGTRSTSSQRALAGTDLTYIGFCTDTNGIDLSNGIITYFNAANMSHMIRKAGNIALFGEKYTILNQNALPSAFSIRNYMDINATNTVTIHNGTAPSGNIADAIQAYAADITAGNTAMHIRNENGDIIKLYKETTAVAAATLVSNLGTIITSTDTFDGYTLQQVVKALRNQGLLA